MDVIVYLMKNVDYGYEWWTVEPPDYDSEPPYNEDGPAPRDEEYDARKPLFTANQIDSFDYLNGSESHSVFENVRVTEAEGELSFQVPKRRIHSENLGRWELEVYGKRRWFKEHDDYGEIRFLADGTGLWIPHLFPFEETRANGMPTILDRERCELTITMKSMQTFKPNESPIVLIDTPQGTAIADIRLNIEETYSADRNYFKYFEMQDKPFISQLLGYDERWRSLREYLNDPATSASITDYERMMMSEIPIPEEYLRSQKPNDWTERSRADYDGLAFGTIWVPVDELRRGINSTISFPNFSTSANTT